MHSRRPAPPVLNVSACAQAWDLRLEWLSDLLKNLGEKQWSASEMVSVMIDNCLSFNDLIKFRQALSLKYSKEHDRFMHPVWVVPQCDLRLAKPRFLKFPEPVPPIYLIKTEFKKYESELKVEVSEDGKVASHSFRERVIQLHEEHKRNDMLNKEGAGDFESNKHYILYSFDAFPCKGISIEHAIVASASLK